MTPIHCIYLSKTRKFFKFLCLTGIIPAAGLRKRGKMQEKWCLFLQNKAGLLIMPEWLNSTFAVEIKTK
jgi:hypothetical protein